MARNLTRSDEPVNPLLPCTCLWFRVFYVCIGNLDMFILCVMLKTSSWDNQLFNHKLLEINGIVIFMKSCCTHLFLLWTLTFTVWPHHFLFVCITNLGHLLMYNHSERMTVLSSYIIWYKRLNSVIQIFCGAEICLLGIGTSLHSLFIWTRHYTFWLCVIIVMWFLYACSVLSLDEQVPVSEQIYTFQSNL